MKNNIQKILLGIFTVCIAVFVMGGCGKEASPEIRTTPTNPVLEITPTLRESKEQRGIFPLFTSLELPNSPDSYYDLDNAQMYAESEGDIQFQVSNESGQGYYLIPVNGAKAFYWGNEEPSQEECDGIIDQMNSKKIFNLLKGNYICLLTNETNLSRVKIFDFQDGMIRLEYITWKE